MAETSCADGDANADVNAYVDAEETVVLTNLLKFK